MIRARAPPAPPGARVFTPDYPRFDRAALVAYARAAIARGSKSFAAASRVFDRATRERVWLLYAWCRACDDLIDAQDHGGEIGGVAVAGGAGGAAVKRLAAIRMLTARAFSGAPTGNAAFDALGRVAGETGLTRAMADDVLAGFALDAADWRPRTEADLLRYCFHVAGAVGVMMAVVMGVRPDDEDTLDRACDLGIAFQLANIARDIAEDAAAGRCYLPADWLAAAGIAPEAALAPAHRDALVALAARLCALEAVYEASARVGARRLAFRRRWAVLTAAGTYGAIAREVEHLGGAAWDARVYTSRRAKLGHLARGFVRALAPAGGRRAAPPPISRRELSRAALATETGARAESG